MLTVAGLLGAVPAAALEPAPARLDYQVDEGLNINRFVREDGVAAHLVVRSGSDPRILIAFPAGDSGVGVWFAHRTGKVRWMLQGAPRAIQRLDGRGRALHGIVADVTIEAADLQIRQVLLSSVRVLRDYQSLGAAPAAVDAKPVVQGRAISWSRDRLDGALAISSRSRSLTVDCAASASPPRPTGASDFASPGSPGKRRSVRLRGRIC